MYKPRQNPANNGDSLVLSRSNRIELFHGEDDITGVVEVEAPQVVCETGQLSTGGCTKSARGPDDELCVLATVNGANQREPRRVGHPSQAFGEPLKDVCARVAGGIGVDRS